MKSALRSAGVLLLLGITLAGTFVRSASAQVLYGTIVGTVEDPSGGAVPGARVILKNKLTGQSREARTDERGSFLFADAPAGTYDISVSASGFATFVRTDLALLINTTLRADVSLQLGQTSESVVVAANAAQLQTDRADVNMDLNNQQLNNLPIGGTRNYQSLLKLAPGFTPPVTSNSIAGNPAGSLVTNVNGTSYSNNNTRVDGVSTTYLWLPHLTAYVPPLESIGPVNVVSNSYDAEQGFVGGSVVNLEIKSGTNEFHGSGFEYNTNNGLKARNYFLPASQRNPKDIINQFGGTAGGPVVRNKLFFFISYEGMRERTGASKYVTVATADQRQGNFSAYGTRIYDPLTGAADGSGRLEFPNAVVPGNRIEAISKKLIDLLPAPNLPGLTNNLFVSGPMQFNRDNYDVKMNWNLSSATSIFGRYSQFNYSTLDQHDLAAAGGTGIYSGFPGRDGGTVRSATLGGTRVFSPNFLVDAHAGYTRQVQLGHDSFYGQNVGLDVLGIPGTNGPDIHQSGFPGFSVSSYEGFGDPVTSTPRFRWDNQFQYAANASWTRGAHNLRWGVDIARQDMNRFQPQSGFGPRGGFTFAGGVTTIRGGASPNQFNSWAAFLLGMPSSLGKSTQTLDPMCSRTWADALYVRDQWRVSSRLTLNIGLRWEYYPMPTRDHRGFERYDPATNTVLVGGVGQVPEDTGVELSRRLFAPRFGAAYRVGAKTVVRAGYGISVDPYAIAKALFEAYPIVVTQTYSGANTFQPAGLLKNGIPPYPGIDLGNGTIPIPSTVADTTIEKNYRRGYIESFNFTLQRELPAGFTAQAGYVGTRSIRQTALRDLNAAPPGTGAAGQPLNILYGRTAATSLDGPAWTANYNSLQAKLDRRFANGWLVGLAYTFSKAIGYAANSDSGLFFNTPSAIARNRAVLNYDRPQNLEASFSAELPFGQGKRWANQKAVARAVLGGWQANGIFSAYSGTPFNVTSSGTSLNAPGNSQVADLVKSSVAIPGGVGFGNSYFDPLAFKPVTAARFGNAGLSILRGPGLVNLDFGLFREFKATERVRVQFRAEAFNLSNTPHFNNPGANVSNLLLNGDGSVRSLNGFTEITSAYGERQLRFGLRVGF